MIDDLRPYAEMKPTGLPWLGDVPAHWEVRKLGRIGRFFKGSGGTKDDALPVGIPCVRYGDLYTTHSFFIRKARTYLSEERSRDYTTIQFGDVLFAASGETIEDIGKSAVNLLEGIVKCGGDTIVLRPGHDVYPPFMGYAADCNPSAVQKAMMGRGTTVKHIYPGALKQLLLTLPPLEEQRLIVRFLDWHGGQVARLVRAKKALIGLLNDQKQAIIHRAVTCGLDPNAKLKPSGIPWLGDVPEGWEVKKLKYLVRFNNGLAFKPSDWSSSGIPIIRIQNLNGSEAFNYTTKTGLPEDLLIIKGDIVFSWSGNIGTSFGPFVWERDFDGYLNQHIFKLEKIGAHRQYFYYVLKAVTKNVEENTHGIIGLVHITKPELGSISVPLAPVDEQIAIANWLDEKLEGLNGIIDRAQREIALIQEFRTRMIADVVTGKLDVRALAASLPETAVQEATLDDQSEDDGLDDLPDDLEPEEAAA